MLVSDVCVYMYYSASICEFLPRHLLLCLMLAPLFILSYALSIRINNIITKVALAYEVYHNAALLSSIRSTRSINTWHAAVYLSCLIAAYPTCLTRAYTQVEEEEACGRLRPTPFMPPFRVLRRRSIYYYY